MHLQLLPALPPEEPVDAPAPPAPALVPLPTWSGWCLGLTPGRVSAKPAPRPAPANDSPPTEKPFRKKCQPCGTWFTDVAAFLYHPCRLQTFPMVLFWDFVSVQLPAGSGRRKCSPFPRAKSRNFSKTIKRREEKRKAEGGQADLPAIAAPKRNPNLPLYREDCKDGPRPCPLVSCRHHAAFTVNEETGSVKENFPHLRIYKDPGGLGLWALEAMHGSCSLDIADEIQAEMMGGEGGDGVPGLLALAKTAVAGQPIGQTEGYTLEQVAKRLGLSLERVRQLGARGLQEVRVALRRADGARPGRAGR